MSNYPAYRVAAAHVAPVFLDRTATAEKVCAVIEEAARGGAQLVAFPETYIPAFPVWCSVRAPIHNHDFFRRLAASTVLVPGPELTRIASTARRGCSCRSASTKGRKRAWAVSGTPMC